MFLGVDWQTVFVPTISLLEIFVRGTVMYLVLFGLLRFVLKRERGTVGITDLLVVVLLADAAQNALAGGYESITEGILLVATIIFWSYALDWIGYRFPSVRRLVQPRPLPLIQDGQFVWENMRKELVTEEELMSQLRQRGIEDTSGVKYVYMEGDGRFSIIERETDSSSDAADAA